MAHLVDSLPIRMVLGEEVLQFQLEGEHLDQEDLLLIEREVQALHLVEDHLDPEGLQEEEEEEVFKHPLDHRQDMVHREAPKEG